MTELPRLLDHSDDDFELALLGSARAELPRPAALGDAALAIGLTATTAHALAAAVPATSVAAASAHVAGVAAPLGAGSAVGTASTVAVAGGASGVAASATVAALGKGLLGGALVTLLGLTAVDRLATPTPPRTLAPLSAAEATRAPGAVPASPTPVLPQPAPEAGLPPASGATEPNPAHAVRRPAPPPEAEPLAAPEPRNKPPTSAAFAPISLPAPSSPAVLANPSLAAEIQKLDRARAALARGDAAAARQALDAYTAGRPSSTLSHEAALLREALRDLEK